jgi:UDP-2,3-diacylglucosamine pyrophosphatase LpxH
MLKQQFANWEDKRTRIPIKGQVIRFGAIADTHLGSKYSQPSFLAWFYQYIKTQGAQFVLHGGDVVDGEKVYRGHDYEVFAHGFDEQLEYVVKRYPNGLPTYFITGNHCLAWFERGGADIGTAIANRRPDMHYLGQLGAYVYIGKAKVYLVHGMGMPAYALS